MNAANETPPAPPARRGRPRGPSKKYRDALAAAHAAGFAEAMARDRGPEGLAMALIVAAFSLAGFALGWLLG